MRLRVMGLVACATLTALVITALPIVAAESQPAAPSSLEARLSQANICLTEVEGKIGQVRGWLISDASYETIADNCLKILNGAKLKSPSAKQPQIPLEVIVVKYRIEVTDKSDWIEPSRCNDLGKLRKAMLKTWNERTETPAADFASIVEGAPAVPPAAPSAPSAMQPRSEQAAQAPAGQSLEARLLQANICLTEVPGREDVVRGFLQSDLAYEAIASNCLVVLRGQRLKSPSTRQPRMPLDVIMVKYRILVTGKNEPITAAQCNDPDALRKAILQVWNERSESPANDFKDIIEPLPNSSKP